ncbi:MAG: Pr6Pr family membrane protein [Solirubrobacteraceae bacterium]
MERGVIRVGLRLARGGLAAIDIVAMLILAFSPGVNVANYLSYFTIQSNILAVIVLAVGAVADPRDRRWAYVRGAVTLYIVITGIVYNTLLLNADVGVTAAWLNDVVHRVVPALALLDWIVFSPWARTRYRSALAWLAYPIAYIVYSLIRGPIVDWYPYPFVDPRLGGGYGRVAIYIVVLAVVFGLLALGVNAIGRWRLGSRAVPRGVGVEA